MACPASAALPQVKDEGGSASQRGTAIHTFLSDVASGLTVESALRNCPEEWRSDCEQIKLDGLPLSLAEGWVSEPAYAYDVVKRTARFIGLNIGRNYGDVSSTEIPLSLDVINAKNGIPLTVYDYKTGRGHDSYAPAPEKNWQLKLGALVLTQQASEHDCMVGLIHIHDDGTHTKKEHLLTNDGLGHAANEIERVSGVVKELRQLVANGGTPSVNEGPHCDFCPAKLACPAKVGLIKLLADAPERAVDLLRIGTPSPLAGDDVKQQVLSLLTKENAAQAYTVARRISRVSGQIMSALAAYASTDPIDVAPGVAYGKHSFASDEIDGACAYQSAKNILGEDSARVAVEMTTSKAAIDRAVRDAKERGAWSGTLVDGKRAVLEAVSKMGGISQVQKTKVEEFKK